MSKRLRANKKKNRPIELERTWGLLSTEAVEVSDFDRWAYQNFSNKSVVDQIGSGIREAIEPYIDPPSTPATRAAIQLAIERTLENAKRLELIHDYTQTPRVIARGDGVVDVHFNIAPTVALESINMTISFREWDKQEEEYE